MVKKSCLQQIKKKVNLLFPFDEDIFGKSTLAYMINVNVIHSSCELGLKHLAALLTVHRIQCH